MFDESYITDFNSLLEKNLNINDELEEIKKDIKNNVSGNTIKTKILRFLAHSKEELSTEYTSVFSLLRTALVIGIPMTINPLLAIPVYIAHRLIKDTADAKVIGRYISDYNLEIERVKKAINKEINEDKKKIWQSYLEELEKSKKTMMAKREELLIDKKEGDSQLKDVLSDSLDLLEYEYNMLTAEQKLILFGEMADIDCSELLDEAGKIKDIKMKVKKTTKAISNKEKKMDTWFNDTMKELRSNFRNSKREEVVEEQFPKLSKMIRRAIIIGASFAINPAIAALSAAVMFVSSKFATRKSRLRLISDLNRELEIVEEKIKDADANGDKEQKYELMRLRQKLNFSKDKVKGLIN